MSKSRGEDECKGDEGDQRPHQDEGERVPCNVPRADHADYMPLARYVLYKKGVEMWVRFGVIISRRRVEVLHGGDRCLSGQPAL